MQPFLNAQASSALPAVPFNTMLMPMAPMYGAPGMAHSAPSSWNGPSMPQAAVFAQTLQLQHQAFNFAQRQRLLQQQLHLQAQVQQQQQELTRQAAKRVPTPQNVIPESKTTDESDTESQDSQGVSDDELQEFRQAVHLLTHQERSSASSMAQMAAAAASAAKSHVGKRHVAHAFVTDRPSPAKKARTAKIHVLEPSSAPAMPFIPYSFSPQRQPQVAPGCVDAARALFTALQPSVSAAPAARAPSHKPPSSRRKSKKRSGQAGVQKRDSSEITVPIECGADVTLADNSQATVSKLHVPFFGGVVDVYQCYNKPEAGVLFKASLLAEKFNCTNNMLAMYLARTKTKQGVGIYQAQSFVHKTDARRDLKTGGYFVTLRVCHAFKDYCVIKRRFRYRRKARRPTKSGSQIRQPEPASLSLHAARHVEVDLVDIECPALPDVPAEPSS